MLVQCYVHPPCGDCPSYSIAVYNYVILSLKLGSRTPATAATPAVGRGDSFGSKVLTSSQKADIRPSAVIIVSCYDVHQQQTCQDQLTCLLVELNYNVSNSSFVSIISVVATISVSVWLYEYHFMSLLNTILCHLMS